jgi:energy-converting hydrogenase Eha subunit A
MEFLYFAIYIAIIVALVIGYSKILQKESGKDKLSWKENVIVYLAALGTPAVVLDIVAILIKLAYFIFL